MTLLVLYLNRFARNLIIIGLSLAVVSLLIISIHFAIHRLVSIKVMIHHEAVIQFPRAFHVDTLFYNETASQAAFSYQPSIRKLQRNSFQEYQSMQGHFSFQYPTFFTLTPKEFEGEEILYHIDFQDNANKAHGFVQVWNLPGSLDEFLQSSKNNSTLNYSSFLSKPVTVNKIPGFLWDYVVLGKNQKFFKGLEVFLKKGGKMYRISYFAPMNQWDQQQEKIFWKMVDSLKIL